MTLNETLDQLGRTLFQGCLQTIQVYTWTLIPVLVLPAVTLLAAAVWLRRASRPVV